MHRLIFVAGVPATGKTSLGNWVAEELGYLHIDAEKDGGIDFYVSGIHEEWSRAVATGRAETFVAALRALDTPVVLSWGFPVEFLYAVQALRAAGMELWWFSGERRQARAAYVQRYLRGRGPHPGHFDPQMDKIEQHWLLIASVFEDHIIDALNEDGSQRTPSELWAAFARTGG